MQQHKLRRQAGFTIVELMIATAVFSSVLLVCSFAIVYVGRLYFKGSLTSRTQDASRRSGEDITQAIQFGAGGIRGDAAGKTYGPVLVKSWCIGEVRYSYSTDWPMGDTGPSHILWKDRVAADDAICLPLNLILENPSTTPGSASTGGGEELLGNRMRVPVFEITPPSGTSSLYKVNLIVSYGDINTVFVTGSNFTICKGSTVSGDFCAVSAYKTSVARRL